MNRLVIDRKIFLNLWWRNFYIPDLRKISKLFGSGEGIRNRIVGVGKVLVEKNEVKVGEFDISNGIGRLFRERGIVFVEIGNGVSSDMIFEVLRCALRMRKEELINGFSVKGTIGELVFDSYGKIGTLLIKK